MIPYLRINGTELNPNQAGVYLAQSEVSWLGIIQKCCNALDYNPVNGHPWNFRSPAVDPAPWFDSSTPESADFLGVGIEEVKGLAGENVARQAFDRVGGGVGGSTLGPLHLKGKKLEVKALIISQSEAGDEYGIRWVNSLLQSECTGTCVPYDVQVRTFCPPNLGANFYDGYWTLRRCGVVTGLTWQTALVFQHCLVREFTFSIQSEYGFVYSQPTPVVPVTSLYDGASCTNFNTWICGGTTISTTLTAPLFGDLCPIISIESGSAETGEFWVEEDGNILYYIDNLPANHTFTIDSSIQAFTLTDDATGVAIDGTPYLELAQNAIIQWPIVNCGQTHTVSLTGAQCGVNPSTTGTIDTTIRQV